MIFKSVLIHLISVGKKTQTRQLVKAQETEPRWKVGRAYAAQPAAGKSATMHFIVTDIRQEALGDLTFEDARAEGFKTRDDFYEDWAGKYRVAFPLVANDLERRVWVLTFRRDDRDLPRLLAARMGRGDYTSDPHQGARDEPEALTDTEHARLFEHAQAKDFARRRQPFASSMENLRRELDALRERMADEGLSNARLSRAIDQMERGAAVFERNLAA